MNKWIKISSIAVMAAFVTALALSSAAFAAEPINVGRNGGPGGGVGGGGRGPDNSLMAVAAQTLGLTQVDLVAQLNGGQSLSDIATAKGVSLETIAEAYIAQRTEALKLSVAAGNLTQAQADTMLATMKVNVLAQLNAPFTPRGAGPGTGTAFVDADGDGLCDNVGTYQQQGSGKGRRNP